MNRRLVLCLIALLCWRALAQAQSHAKSVPASARKLVEVKVTGTQRYTEKEITLAGGMELGKEVSESDFKQAAQQLGESGLFSNVGYTFTYSPSGTKLEWQLKDTTDKLVPAKFENFVWFKDAELQTELERRVPLFKDVLPLGGIMADRVSAALQDMVSEKRLPGHVDYLRESTPGTEELIAIAYRVADVEVRMRKAEFPGAGPEELAALTKEARKLEGGEYIRSALARVAELDFLPIYRARGYLKASFGATEAQVVEHPDPEESRASPMSAVVIVDVIFPIQPGHIYSAAGLTWKGNSVLSTAQLQGLVHLPEGKPANAVRLQEDLEQVQKLYHSRGYMEARITPVASIDDEKGTAHYEVNVTEGDQYKMGELELLGLDSQARDKLQGSWGLREGDPYDASYVVTFLQKYFLPLSWSGGWRPKVETVLNVKDKTADVTIRFTPK